MLSIHQNNPHTQLKHHYRSSHLDMYYDTMSKHLVVCSGQLDMSGNHHQWVRRKLLILEQSIRHTSRRDQLLSCSIRRYTHTLLLLMAWRWDHCMTCKMQDLYNSLMARDMMHKSPLQLHQNHSMLLVTYIILERPQSPRQHHHSYCSRFQLRFNKFCMHLRKLYSYFHFPNSHLDMYCDTTMSCLVVYSSQFDMLVNHHEWVHRKLLILLQSTRHKSQLDQLLSYSTHRYTHIPLILMWLMDHCMTCNM